MDLLRNKNICTNSILVFVFILLSFLVGANFSNAARIDPYGTPASCVKDSECKSSHGTESCCMADIYSNNSLYNYFACLSTGGTPESCPAISGVVSNKCWPGDVCTNGLDYAISGNRIIDGKCGAATGRTSVTSAEISSLKTNGAFCSAGTLSYDPKLNNTTRKWTWVCAGENGGVNADCTVNYADTQNNQINGVCYTYSSPVSVKPTNLCVSGVSGVVVLNEGTFSWTCSGTGGGASVSCSAEAKSNTVPVTPQPNPFSPLQDDPLTKPTTNGTTTQTEIVSSYPTIEQTSANISSYSLLEKYASPCTIKFDSQCEVLDQGFLDAANKEISIQEAVTQNKVNGNSKVARVSWVCSDGSGTCNGKGSTCSDSTGTCIAKELDNYKTGLTLTNIQKLRAARVLPVGMELAAMCITGQTMCANGLIYDGGGDNNTTGCVDLNNDGQPEKCHKQPSAIGDVTLNMILTGYSNCDPLMPGKYSSKNSPFCHLVNPNWILKNPQYMCESGEKNGPLLYVTDKQSQSNIRYEYCPDVSTCLSEKNNGDCLTYGYCLREKNIWRFDLSADSCQSRNVGCAKYSYTMGGVTTTLGFVSDTTDVSVCDASNSGCRRYSTIKTGSDSSDWSYDNANKIFLNNKVTVCDSSQEGCTAFIRRDSANLVKNSSFEEYFLGSDNYTKQALLWKIDYAGDEINNTIFLQTANDGMPIYNGSNVLAIKRLAGSTSDYAAYSLEKDYFVDVEPNKTYTLSYYILGYNIGFASDDLSKNSAGAFVNIKEYNQNKVLVQKKICTKGNSAIASVNDRNSILGNLCATNVDCGGGDSICSSSGNNNIIDVNAVRYVSTFVSSTWTRKTVTFKTGLDTYYLNLLPMLSRIKTSATNPGNVATVLFDAIQLQEGSNATSYRLYENSDVNYLKKAPDYSNCYTSSSDKDEIFCSNFIKSCDKKDVGCRKYTKKDDEDYWLPGKPSEENYCTSECKGYQLYKESGPSYDPVSGSTFQSLIATTAKTCTANEAGCSEYKSLSTQKSEYYSFIRSCVKETNDIGTCKSNTAKICSSDADCGGTAGDCLKTKNQYADYFTYTGSESSGYKLNVYRLLRTRVCSNNTSMTCNSDSDCSTGISCIYNDNIYAPAVVVASAFNKCTSDAYKKSNHDADCREFHGPRDSTAAAGDSNGDYILYYANMSEVVYASDASCVYHSIVPYLGTVSKSKCDSVSRLPANIRYDSINNLCNIGIYIPEAVACSGDSLNCREYSGTSTSSETLFTNGFEGGTDGWKSGTNDANVSTESIFVNEHSAKLVFNESISKIVAPDIIDPTEKAYYKLRLYAKNNSADGSLSTIRLRVGSSFVNSKQVSNDWKLISFDIFASSDLTNTNNTIQLTNLGLVASGTAVDLYVDYISIEKSSAVYVIKDTWKTPVSCDNNIDNPTGVCNAAYQAAGFCTMQPSKVCLTGENIGANCSTASDCSSDHTDKGDTCAYANQICRWGDNKNASCNNDDDCYNDPNNAINITAKVGACHYTIDGYRLELGKMIGCDEYVDSYNNNNFYVFNDLNLCNADKMGCEALYDTQNSSSYQKQTFNEKIDYTNVVAYYTFDDKNNINKNDFSSSIITNTGSAVYVKDGVSSGAALFNGNNSISEPINSSLKSIGSNITIYAWVRPNSLKGDIISFGNYYKLSIATDSAHIGQAMCMLNNSTTNTVYSGAEHKLSPNVWQNVVCTYDGDRLRIYINGEFVNSSDNINNITFNYGTDTTSLFRIGNGVVGSVDDVRIYNKFYDSKSAYDAYDDYSDNYTVDADELGYYIIDSNYSCDSKYKGCMALGRNDDVYDSSNFDYSTVYLAVNPDKFNSSGNYATTGVYDGNMCTIKEEGCYSFTNANSASVNFKFPKNLCVYRTNVDVGVSDADTGNSILQNGWFKYDVKTKEVTSEGCYLQDIISKYQREGGTGDLTVRAKQDASSYQVIKSSDCEYKKDPVVVKRTFYGVCSNNSTTECVTNSDCGGGTCNLNSYITRPKQTTYYTYKGTCSDNVAVSCSENSQCSSGSCVLERTNAKCDPKSGNPYCKPYGYDENPGVIDQYSNKSFEFNVCQSGTSVGSYCDSSSDCNGSAACGSPWTVIGWFKKDSTKGCSDDGLECVGGTNNGKACVVDSDCGAGKCQEVVEYTDYLRNYNSSVGVCNEYGCTNFIEPTEKKCTAGSLYGFQCASNSDCGSNGVCLTDELNGSKYCGAKSCVTVNDCDGGSCVGNKCSTVNKQNKSCNSDSDCGFAGVCTGNNIYSYINNSKINSSGCNGTVSRESGCILFNDTSNSQLKFSSKLTYANVKNGVAVAAITGDNSGGDSQKDSNVIIKVKRDRECAEWMTFDVNGSTTKQDYNPSADNSGVMFPTCTKLSEDNRCVTGATGSGWSTSVLDTKFYISQMNGDWFNNDFSGLAIPGQKAVINGVDSGSNVSYWWQSSKVGSTSILSANSANSSNVICKSYPETDSPFNFSDKYDVSQLDSTNKAIYDSGKKITYTAFKDLVPRDYFKNVNSGISVPYGGTDDVYIKADNSQDCYYQKVNYKDLMNPRAQYFGTTGTLPVNVCYNSSDGIAVTCANGKCNCDSSGTSLEAKIANYTSGLDYRGYCAEYDYSHEIYYIGSGKYNCITWVPGFISGR